MTLAQHFILSTFHQRFLVFEPCDLEWRRATQLAVQTHVLTLQPFNGLRYFDKGWRVYEKISELLERQSLKTRGFRAEPRNISYVLI